MKVLHATAALGVGLLLWSGVHSLHTFLLKGHERAHTHTERAGAGADGEEAVQAGAARQDVALPEQARARISSLEAQVKQEPDSAGLRTDLGYALLTHGLATGEGGELIAALKQFDHALKLNPQEPRALLGIAGISLRVGVYEKAAEYYERYLALSPDNIQALSDYGLALARLERLEDARKTLTRAREIDAASIPVLMVSAMIEEQANEHGQARLYAERALALANDDASAGSIRTFIEGLQGSGTKNAGARATTDEVDSTASPSVIAARQYFSEHPILAPKLRQVVEEAGVIKVYVHDFPVAAMPPIAKERFSANVNERLAPFKASLQAVDILEDGTNALLMRIELE